MKEQFVTYEIALKLKELGFDKPCFGFFDGSKNNKLWYEMPNKGINYIPTYAILAPLWQQVINWFRNKHKLLINSPIPDEWNNGKWSIKIISMDRKIVLEEHVDQPYWRIYRCFNTFNEAYETAILKAIELCQNN